MSASRNLSETDSISKIVTFSDLASEYEKLLTENRYGSVGWILLHSKIQKCYCLCRSEAPCSDDTNGDKRVVSKMNKTSNKSK